MFKRILFTILLSFLPAYLFADTYLVYRVQKPDYRKRFFTIETEHFFIHYHNGLEDWAKGVNNIAEDVYEKLTQEFNYHPEEKTHVVIMDRSDLVSGYAMVFPYNTIFLNPGYPDLDTTIGEYDNFLYNLFVHEYAHILSMDVTEGYSGKLRKIFGKPVPAETPSSGLFFLLLSPPNIFMPRWWHEGIATEVEAKYGFGGRGKRSFYDMVFRMAVEEDYLPSIDMINGDIPFWTKGHSSYIYGYNLFAYLKERYDLKYSFLVKRHSARVPYFINAVPKQLFNGKDYKMLYEESLQWLKEKQGERLKAFKTTKLTEGERLPFNHEIIKNPRLSGDGKKIAFRSDDPDEGAGVIVAERESGKILAEIPAKNSRGSIVFSPDGNKIYFPRIVRKEAGYFQSLYQHDLSSGKTKRIFDGLRIKDIDLDAEGKHFIAIYLEDGKEGVAKIDVSNPEKPEVTTIIKPEACRLGQVRWSKDGRIVVYSKKVGGKSSISVLNLETREEKVLLESPHILEYPAFGDDERGIYFISDETGIFNIYFINIADGDVKAVTNLVGGALFFDVRGGEIVYSSYHAKGIELRAIKAEKRLSVKELVKLDRDKAVEKAAIFVDKEAKPVKYSPIPTLKPGFFIPNILSDHRGTVLGFFTAGQDAIGYHTYTAEIDRGVASGENYFSINYLNDVFKPTFKVTAYAQPLLYSNFANLVDLWERSSLFRLETIYPLGRVFIRFGYEYEEKEPLNAYAKLLEGYFYKGNISTFLYGIDLISLRKTPKAISYEGGRSLSLLGKVSGRFLGGSLSKTEYFLFYDEYIDLKVTKEIKHDVFHINFNAALSKGREVAQGAFQLGGYKTPFIHFPLRGYTPRFETGEYIYTGSLEYRFPVAGFYKGRGTTPVFYENLSVNAFFDFGNIWGYGRKFSDDVKTALGYELKLDITLGYWLKVTPTLGVAKGLSKEGEKQLYFTIYSNF